MRIHGNTHTPRFPAVVTTLILLVALVPHRLWGQNLPAPRALSVVAGPANYDLSGTGWSWSAAAKLDLPLGRLLIVEPSLGFFTYDSQSSASMLLPELSLQLQYPGARVRPYLGVGAGGAFVIQGSGSTEPTVHAAVGLRAPLSAGWGLRGEARVRNISLFEANASILEFVAGLSRQF
jgi:hypothetical protein